MYPQYLKDQIQRAESKWGRKHDYDEIFKQQLNLTIDQVDEFINPQSICCMGCRQGTEVFEFKERFPKAEVCGVDITKNIESIQTHLDVKFYLEDFNKLPEDWTDKFDLVFSNSIDHAFKPEETIKEWARVCIGHLLLEFSTARPSNLEHQFTSKKVSTLMQDFREVVKWTSPEREIITGLYQCP